MVEQLIREHDRLIRAIASDYRLPGGDQDDAYQEALIGFYGAVLSYDPVYGRSFPRFAAECVRRRMRDALQAACRLKHQPLNTAARTAIDEETGETVCIVELAPDPFDVERIVLAREELRQVIVAYHGLPISQREALTGVLNGQSLGELGGKRADNAVYAARRRLKEAA